MSATQQNAPSAPLLSDALLLFHEAERSETIAE